MDELDYNCNSEVSICRNLIFIVWKYMEQNDYKGNLKSIIEETLNGKFELWCCFKADEYIKLTEYILGNDTLKCKCCKENFKVNK